MSPIARIRRLKAILRSIANDDDTPIGVIGLSPQERARNELENYERDVRRSTRTSVL